MKNVIAIEYDHQWEVTARETFEWAEEAFAWAEARAGVPLHWGDTQVGMEGNTQANFDSLDKHGTHAEGQPIFQVHAIDNEDPDSVSELYSFHYDPKKATDEELKDGWHEATHMAEGNDDWNIVAAYEDEVNRRNLNQKGGE